jgi:hypothetical protein
MKRILLVLVTLALLLNVPALDAKGRSATSKSRTSKPKGTAARSKKSSVPGSKDGTYAGGKGSSHKGGRYKNTATGNKERNRKAGVPK